MKNKEKKEREEGGRRRTELGLGDGGAGEVDVHGQDADVLGPRLRQEGGREGEVPLSARGGGLGLEEGRPGST